jgi:hypothetical protein
MAEFIVSQERVQDAVNVIVQFLRDAGYAGSLEDGTGLNDIVVKPSALLREMFAQMVDKASAYQSLQKALELKDVIGDDEYDAAVDCILSNWFVTRNGGKPSTGLVRLWFLQPPDFMQFQDGEAVGTVDGVSLVADGNQVFTESSFSCILNTTENQNEYYVDVAVKTAENSVITPSSTSGAEVSVQYNDIYYLRATLPGTFTPGVLVESSEDFIRRTGQAITTRELITARAINTVLLDSFSDIIRLYVARHGSREQLRDIVRFQGVSVHVGNKADIYIASSLAKQELTVFADENGDIDVAQLPAEVSVVAYISARDADGVALSFSVDCEEAVWCSARYIPKALHVEGQGAVSLTLLTDTVVGQVRDFVYSEEQRVACYDPMVKHMFPLVLRPVLNVELVDRSVDSVSAIKDAVLEYLDYVVVNAQPWVASELIASIHVRVENVKKILLPVACTGSIYDPLTKRNCDIEIGNKFTVGTDFAVRHSDQITDNTVQFYTDRDLITVVSDYEEA